MSYTGSVPGYERALDWRDTAACGETDPDGQPLHDPELWFPVGYTHPVALAKQDEAKAICARCPSLGDCLNYALAAHLDAGIFGGLNEKERRALRRASRRGRQPSGHTPAPRPERTLQDILTANTKPLRGGHQTWTGPTKVHFSGQIHTPKQASFIADRGHAPAGRLRAGCGIDECVLAAHLIEVPKEAGCGTRPGYQKHLREKTEACGPCRNANTQADRRLRETGTSRAGTPKVLAKQPATLAEAFQARAQQTDDGHVEWRGDRRIEFQNATYSALRVSFELGHDRAPEGPIRRTCGKDCYLAEHLTDAIIREALAVCGTTLGYAQHLKRGETTCQPCRNANAGMAVAA